MRAPDEVRPDERSAVADAIGGAAAYSARVAARVWRGPLEAAAEELLSTPEIRRALDRTLSSPLPEELGRLLVRHRVVERVVHELVASVVGGVRPDWLAQALLSLATVAIAFGYFGLFWRAGGQTPGMRLMGVRVLSQRDDGRLTSWQAILRTIGLALAIIPCFLGF